jgi:hypothetical protein
VGGSINHDAPPCCAQCCAKYEMLRLAWRQVRDSVPSMAQSMRWCAQCGGNYDILRQVWRQVRDVVQSMSPIKRCCAKYGGKYDLNRPSWLWAQAPIIAPLCCAKYGATYKIKCPSWCQLWLHVRDNDIESIECWCQVWDQSSNETPIMAPPCLRQVWLQV